MFCQPWQTKNPQDFSKEAFICGEHYGMYYFFSVKQNVKDILIDGHGRK